MRSLLTPCTREACQGFFTPSFQTIQKKMEFVPTLMAPKDQFPCLQKPLDAYFGSEIAYPPPEAGIFDDHLLEDMAEIGCSYIPMATYPVAKLKKMKVLVEVCPPHDAMQKLMEITVKKLDAQAVQITVSIAHLSSKSKALSKA